MYWAAATQNFLVMDIIRLTYHGVAISPDGIEKPIVNKGFITCQISRV